MMVKKWRIIGKSKDVVLFLFKEGNIVYIKADSICLRSFSVQLVLA